MFCTNNPMTRGEVAGFISRGFQYPAASRDYFSDDNGDANEPYINRIAEAGLTHGCDPGKYCPSKRTTSGPGRRGSCRGPSHCPLRPRTITTMTTGRRSRTI